MSSPPDTPTRQTFIADLRRWIEIGKAEADQELVNAAQAALKRIDPDVRPTTTGSRWERRDRERTTRVARAAVHRAHGSATKAVHELQIQAEEALKGAVEALRSGAGEERTQQLMDRAARRLRAAAEAERIASEP